MRGWLLAGLIVLCSTPAAAGSRVVSLAPFLTDIVILLEATDSLVGVLNDGNLPDELDQVPRVGGHQSVSLERIAVQRPDLVLAWTSGNSPALLQQLEGLGIPVLRFDPRRLSEIAEVTQQIAAALGRSEAGRLLNERFQAELEASQVPLGPDSPGVFLQLWDDPLYTVAGAQLISDALNHCGARNVFEDLPGLAPQVGREGVLGLDPDIIIALSDNAHAGQTWLDKWRRYPQLKAVRNDALHVLANDELVRPTPRIIDGLRLLCRAVQGG